MKLTFKTGDVVAILFSCGNNPQRIAGKVVSMEEEELVLQPQQAMWDPNASESSDEGPEIHMDASTIIMWRYAYPYELKNHAKEDAVYYFTYPWLLVDPNPYTGKKNVVNKYDSEGFCRH